MSENQTMLRETTERVFAACAKEDDAAAWARIEASGLPSLLIPEAQGGFGGDWSDAFAVMRLAGAHAVRAPIGEAITASFAAARAGLTPTDARSVIVQSARGASDASGLFSGSLAGAAWGGDAAHVIFAHEGRTLRLQVKDARMIARRVNPAGEARDDLVFEHAPAERGETVDIFGCGALIRTAQIAGALDAALFMAIAYANDRVQFDKPIGKFQAVQQSLAVFAEEAAAVNCGGQAAARAADSGEAIFEIAAAKLRANIAAGAGAAIAHQVHGAIGFTQEYQLHPLTRRLVSWRSEFGNDRHWADVLGGQVARLGADGLWPFVTSRSDRF